MTASIHHQVDRALGAVTWNKKEISAYKKKTGVVSVKKAMRPKGDPTKPLPVILGIGTRKSYYDAAGVFFTRAKMLTANGLLSALLDTKIITDTFDRFYINKSAGTLNKTIAAIYKVYLGCKKLGWTKTSSPITAELREHLKTYSDDFSVRIPRYGYKPEDVKKIIEYLGEHDSAFLLPAEIALECGLRKSEIAGLKGKDIDQEKLIIKVVGKGGRYREVPISADLINKLNTSKQFLFSPKRSWKKAFYQAVTNAASKQNIDLSGVHRLRSNFAQNLYEVLLAQGLSDGEARDIVSKQLGHNRRDVTHNYIP
jgi:integrase